MKITDAQKQQFQEEGYFILENVIPESLLELLRGECGTFIDQMDAEMDRQDTDVLGINHRNKRYFVSNCFRKQPTLREFLFSDLMAEVCRATLGDTAYLFWEQYVVKGAEAGMKFSWHQDSGYVGYPDHKPYLTCWCALDDMSEENGTIYVMPFSHIGINFHCSGTNYTSNLRRAYLAQYSAEPLLAHDGSRLWGNAEPLLRDGQSAVGDPPPDITSRFD